MRNYASKKHHRTRTAFRVPSRFRLGKLKELRLIPRFRLKLPSRFPSRHEGHGKNN